MQVQFRHTCAQIIKKNCFVQLIFLPYCLDTLRP